MSKIEKFILFEFKFSNGNPEIVNPPKETGRYRVLRAHKYPNTTRVFEDYSYYDSELKTWYLNYGYSPIKEIFDVIAYREEASIMFDIDKIKFCGVQPYLIKEPKYVSFLMSYNKSQVKNEVISRFAAGNKKKLVLATYEYQDERLHDMLAIAVAYIDNNEVVFVIEKKDATSNYEIGKRYIANLDNLKDEIIKYANE